MSDIFDSFEDIPDPNVRREPQRPRLTGTVPQQINAGGQTNTPWRVGADPSSSSPAQSSQRKPGFFARLFGSRTVADSQTVAQTSSSVESVSPKYTAVEIDRLSNEFAVRISRDANGHRVSVFSHKGGGTKTANAFGIGNAFGRYSRQGVLLFDGNTDYGTTAIVNGSTNDYSVFDVLEHLDDVYGINDIRRYTSKSKQSRLEVLSSRRGSERALTGANYIKVLNVVEKFWPIVISDSGIDFTTRLAETMIAATDTAIVCSTHSAVYLSLAEETLKKFEKMGRSSLFSRTIISVVSTTPEVADEEKIRSRFAKYGVKSVVFIPYDKYLGNPETTVFNWESLAIETQLAWMQLAAEVSDNFSR